MFDLTVWDWMGFGFFIMGMAAIAVDRMQYDREMSARDDIIVSRKFLLTVMDLASGIPDKDTPL